MRVNVYAEEMTDRIEIVEKETSDGKFTGVRFYLELPVRKMVDPTDPSKGWFEHKGPFIHRDGDDDSSAVTFWSKHDLRIMLNQALALLDKHYGK